MAASANSERAQYIERRCSERFGVENGPFLTLSAKGETHSCRLADISYGGLRIHFEETAPACETVELEHEFVGRLSGTPAWRAEKAMGVEMKVPEQDLEHALKCVGLLISAEDDTQPK